MGKAVMAIKEAEAEILRAKGNEYANPDSPLRAFYAVGDFMGVRAADVALCYLLKHVQGITNALEKPNVPRSEWCMRKEDGSEGLQQRFVDARNYLLLLADIIDEAVL